MTPTEREDAAWAAMAVPHAAWAQIGDLYGVDADTTRGLFAARVSLSDAILTLRVIDGSRGGVNEDGKLTPLGIGFLRGKFDLRLPRA
jgi:hypothetical protein